ncbi:MAG TPA: proton-conducting transporter membrane subunit [Chryseolinea sp.]|nr:proton-conducting transporter membrane subunit [Chryseolinea sp.]
MMIILFKTALLLSFGIFIVPKTWKYSLGLVLHIMVVVSTGTWAFESLVNGTQTIALGVATWSGPIELVIDSLSAFFMLIINLICFCGILYAGGYLKPYLPKKRSVFISLHLFSFLWLHGSMLMVTAMRDGIAFLLAWELMSLFSFVLVIFEAQKESTLKTGINYLLQMHLGFALIMISFLIAANETGGLGFKGVAMYFEQHRNAPLFLLFFAGFGIKAGFIPFHSWLPRAHPAAPSHVSGVMSGVMIKMGIYGIFRITSLIQNDLTTIGIVVLTIGIISGMMGVIMAIMQHDLKKLLAYHSIENIGIIGIGLGVGILGRSVGDDYLMLVGFAGALLHNLNHALFKSLLFFTAGNVFYATHTVNMDNLGGLIKKMRYTSAAFLIGALAISGIPPFNGFISEFLIYNGVLHHLPGAGFWMSLVGVAAILALVLIGGLCIYCFTKAFGMSFLGTRRMVDHQEAHEVTPMMLAPAAIIIGMILFIGLRSSFFGETVIQILQQLTGISSPAIMNDVVQSLTMVSNINLLLILLVGAIVGIRVWQQRQVAVRQGPTWGCGYTAGDFRHQYTPTSYAESLRQLVNPLIDYKRHYKSFAEKEIFPPPRTFHTESKDLIEEKTVLSWVHLIVKYLPKAGVAQSGLINHYLIYPLLFLVIIGLLTILNIL